MKLNEEQGNVKLVKGLQVSHFDTIADTKSGFYYFLTNLIKNKGEVEQIIQGTHPHCMCRDAVSQAWLEHVIRQDLQDLTPISVAIADALQNCYLTEVKLPPIVLK